MTIEHMMELAEPYVQQAVSLSSKRLSRLSADPNEVAQLLRIKAWRAAIRFRAMDGWDWISYMRASIRYPVAVWAEKEAKWLRNGCLASLDQMMDSDDHSKPFQIADARSTVFSRDISFVPVSSSLKAQYWKTFRRNYNRRMRALRR